MKQLTLPLDVPEHLLREAHKRCRVSTEFEVAIELNHFRISLKRVAMLMMERSSKKNRATH